jgi:RND family efflux transporter MFP subunit
VKKIVAVLLMAALVFGAVVLLKKRKESIAETPVAVQPLLRVRTVMAQSEDIIETSMFLAKVDTVKRAGIASKFSGQIREIMVQESMGVLKGAPLIRIDDTEILATIDGVKAQITAATKQLQYNKSLYERNLALFEVGGLAREKLDGSEVSYSAVGATLKELQQKLNGLQSQLDYLNIEAPFDGVVGNVVLHQGDLAVPGKTILTLNSLQQKLTFSFMPGSAVIETGQEVLLKGVSIGKVSSLYDDAVNGLSVAEVLLDKRLENQPNGSFLTISVVTTRATGCSVPAQALLHRSGGQSVMVYKDEVFTEQLVSILAQDDRFARVEPCVTQPVAVASEARLSQLPGHGRVRAFTEKDDE